MKTESTRQTGDAAPRSILAYGPLRDLLPEGLSLPLADAATPETVRGAVVAFRKDSGFEVASLERILARSAVASADDVLREQDTIGAATCLALLPPVCGG